MLQAVFEFILEGICCATGHGLLWAVTLGRWRPIDRGDLLATLVGLLFWGVIVVGLVLLVTRL